MLLFFIIPIFLMIPVGFYFYFWLKRVLKFYGVQFDKKRKKIILVIASVLLCASCVNLFGLPALIILHILAFSILMELIQILVKKFGGNRPCSVWKKLYGCGLVPILLTSIVLCYGYYNMNHLIETDYNVMTEKKLENNGYTIALLSDLHFGTTMNIEKLKSYADEINEKKADLVVLDGDIVDERTSKEAMQACFKTLGDSLKCRDGIVYVYGNHDRASYSNTPSFTESELKQAIQSSNIRILKDEVWKPNETLLIVGRDDRGYRNSQTRAEVSELLKGQDRDCYTVLLDHQPYGLQENKEAGVDLMLSGHTHGGQIWPVGLISDWLLFGEMNYGIRSSEKFTAIVTSGMAGWGYPIRTGHHSEYVLIKINSVVEE